MLASHVSCVLVASDAFHTGTRGSRLGSEEESVANSQVGEVNLGLCIVNDFATEVLVHGLVRNTLVMDIGFGVDRETMGISSDGLKECRAATDSRVSLV